MKKFEIIAKTFFGLEDVLAEELKQLGAEDINVLKRAVSFNGDKKMMYRSNFYLRTAISILQPIHKFTAKDEYEFYDGVQQVLWSDFLDVNDTISITASVTSDHFTHSKYIALKAKDAIVDQFRLKYNARPSVDTIQPKLRINIHINQEDVTVSLDSSGDPLFKRGYRTMTNEAPLNEVLAAGLVYLSGWDAQSNFLDPMCGSGTLPIEAALIAYNIPPGMYRKKFGFENWNDFDSVIFEDIYNESVEKDFKGIIMGSDISGEFVRMTEGNIKNAFLNKKIILDNKPIELVKPPEGNGVAIINPPYGERIGVFDINGFYKMIGDVLKKKFMGYDVWILSSNMEAMKHLGLHASRKIKLYNGSLESKLYKYSIYSGSKKMKK